MTSLVATNLTYRYDGHPAVDDGCIRLTPAKVHALVGPSGAGKSTLLWLLAGLIPPDTGSINITHDDQAAADDPASPSMARLGMVFQPPMLWDHLTVRDHLDLVLQASERDRSTRRTRIHQMLDKTGLTSFANRRAHSLSGGQRQRLALARAVVARPRWLLLDEPMAHLDGPTRSQLFDLLRQLLQETGAGALVATHHADEAMRLADEVSVMIAGHIVQHGTPAEVYHHPINLQVALALGPAYELQGRRDGASLIKDGVPILTDIEDIPIDQSSLILRPADVRFDSAPNGSATVQHCEFTGDAWRLIVDVAGCRAIVIHKTSLPTGSRGILRYQRP